MKTHQLEKTVCLFCKHDRGLSVFPRKFPHFIVCRTCGLVYQNPRVPEHAAASHYQTEYWEARQERSKKPNLARAQGFGEMFMGLLTAQDTVLEIGCGRGEILHHLRESFEVKVVGIEPSASQAAETREMYGFPVLEGKWPDILQENSLQIRPRAIILSHVLEHFFDPHTALEACHRVLAPKGLIAIEVPNIRKPNPAKKLSRWLASEHTYYFSSGTLERLLCETGFSPIVTVNDTFVRILALRKSNSLACDSKSKNELVLSLSGYEA